MTVLILTVLLALPTWALAADGPTSINPETGQVNWWLVAGLILNIIWTQVGMVGLKRFFPTLERLALYPMILGLIGAVIGALATGQIHSAAELMAWIGTGIMSGGTASSIRDVKVGR